MTGNRDNKRFSVIWTVVGICSNVYRSLVFRMIERMAAFLIT